MIESGQSIDTDWQKFMEKMKETNYIVWILIGSGTVLIALLAGVIWFLYKRLKKDEEKMDSFTEHSPESGFSSEASETNSESSRDKISYKNTPGSITFNNPSQNSARGNTEINNNDNLGF